jgi:hypothetical protein
MAIEIEFSEAGEDFHQKHDAALASLKAKATEANLNLSEATKANLKKKKLVKHSINKPSTNNPWTELLPSTSANPHRQMADDQGLSDDELRAVIFGRRSFYERKNQTTPMLRDRSYRPVEIWNLRPMNFIRCAADFYLLERLMAMPQLTYHVKLNIAFNAVRGFLVQQFAAYTDMVIGGELRHIALNTRTRKAIPAVLRRVLGYDSTSRMPPGRHAAWEHWFNLRQRFGAHLSLWTHKAFLAGGWRSGFGGRKWAVIAHTLWLWESEQITDVQFVDTCFSLQHNGGLYFNKVWSVNEALLTPVLDAKFAGDYEKLLKYANSHVRMLWFGLSDTMAPSVTAIDWRITETGGIMQGRRGRDGD